MYSLENCLFCPGSSFQPIILLLLLSSSSLHRFEDFSVGPNTVVEKSMKSGCNGVGIVLGRDRGKALINNGLAVTSAGFNQQSDKKKMYYLN